MKTIRHRVLLADDHRMFAQGLSSVLCENFELVGIASDGRELVDMAPRLQPDVVVADLNMPLLDGISAARELTRRLPAVRVIILTMHANASYAAEALRSGAVGYVLKSSPVDELEKAIEMVMQGRVYVTPELAGQVMSRVAEEDEQSAPELTQRQREVLALTAQGASMKKVALELGISRRTVEYHKYRAMEVLGVDSMADLVLTAARMGLVEGDAPESYNGDHRPTSGSWDGWSSLVWEGSGQAQ